MRVRSVSLPVAVLVVLGAAAVGAVGPARGTPTPAPTPAPTSAQRSARSPALIPAALAGALRPALACPADVGVVLESRATAPAALDESAVVVAGRCDAGAGNPPSGVFLVAADGGSPRVTQTLVPDSADLVLPTVSVSADAVTVLASGFSSVDVPRCCPDRAVVHRWLVRDGELAPAPEPTTTPAPATP